MADEATQAVADDPQPTDEGAPIVPDTTSDAKPAETVADLPDLAQKIIKDLRQENAKHRTAAKAAEKAAEEAEQKKAEEQGEFKRLYEETKQQLDEAQSKAEAAELAALRTKIGAKHQLPGVLADRLTGTTEEEIEADALALLEAMPKASPQTSTDAAAGTNGTAPTVELTDEEIQEKAVRYGVSFEAMKAELTKK